MSIPDFGLRYVVSYENDFLFIYYIYYLHNTCIILLLIQYNYTNYINSWPIYTV